MAPHGGLHPTTNPVEHPVRDRAAGPVPGAPIAVVTDLDRVVAGLRAGDLAFVVTAVHRLGPRLGSCPAAPVDPEHARNFVHDVAFALADLAVADRDAGAETLLERAVERACHTSSP